MIVIGDGDRATISVRCFKCQQDHIIKVPLEDFLAWDNGEVPIQSVFHYLDRTTRELLVSEICPTCFKEVMHVTTAAY